MSDFKVGDEVYFFWTESGRHVLEGYGAAIYPDSFCLEQGVIVNINPDKDSVHVYVKDDAYIFNFGYCYIQDYIFKSKNKAIDAMIKRLEEMRE